MLAPEHARHLGRAGREQRVVEDTRPDSGESGTPNSRNDADTDLRRVQRFLGMGQLVRRRTSLPRLCKGRRSLRRRANLDPGGYLRKLQTSINADSQLRPSVARGAIAL